MERNTVMAYRVLRVAFGVVPIVAGLDKFTNLLTDWRMYLSPLAVRLLPVRPELFLRAAGIVEIVVGAAILLGFARIFGFVAMAWLAAIALNVIATGAFLDVAARDAVMACGAFALAELARVHEPVRARRAARAAGPGEASAHA
ncbi:DoxX family membrane protein [Anaeromyxobacter terrae]|uniref:DoxX family membrane protein n=1 Tax=Anaeromyxobacter terrae TaxID=2925406 RepID=UPI001F56CBDF|nr:DoxX family membrane protein [Anaeromyxobacter sp. SG22]